MKIRDGIQKLQLDDGAIGSLEKDGKELHMKRRFFITTAVCILAVSIGLAFEWFNHDDCPSLCRASSIAKQVKETMSMVESKAANHSKNVQTTSLYVSPFIDQAVVQDDGSIVLSGKRDQFQLIFRPVVGEKTKWRCFGGPEKMVRNINEFLDPGMVKCEFGAANSSS